MADQPFDSAAFSNPILPSQDNESSDMQNGPRKMSKVTSFSHRLIQDVSADPPQHRQSLENDGRLSNNSMTRPVASILKPGSNGTPPIETANQKPFWKTSVTSQNSKLPPLTSSGSFSSSPLKALLIRDSNDSKDQKPGLKAVNETSNAQEKKTAFHADAQSNSSNESLSKIRKRDRKAAEKSHLRETEGGNSANSLHSSSHGRKVHPIIEEPKKPCTHCNVSR
ncbi:hypothetical protein EDD86DRAFT_218776 [Gorgonomyces haynaldii]|nr:hypothetical protein EDD86DRAFT_218776 [Gorgonomyces haynaldii]